MFDLVIRGGTLVGDDRMQAATIAIRDGRIALLAAPDAPVAGWEEIDAAGKLIMPGFVDAHVHLREPGLVRKEGFATGTRAAAAGGVTTVMVMPTDDPWTATAEEFRRKRALAEGNAHVDFALQAAAGPRVGEIEALAELGAISFELFLIGGRPEFLVEADSDLVDLLERIRSVRGIAGVTAGSPAIVARLATNASKLQAPTMAEIAAMRPPISEALGVARACAMAAEVGTQIHLRQISCGAAVGVLERFADCDGISAETTPHNLLLTNRDAERLGPYGTVIPPLRAEPELADLRKALRAGTIDMVATDHAPHLPEEKEQGRENLLRAPPGLPGLQTFCLAMLNLVDLGELSYVEVASRCAAEPARRFGLYPRKGLISEGADADLVLIDPQAVTEIRDEDQQSKARTTPFAGRRVKGRIARVLLRGRTIAQEDRIVGPPSGQFVRPSFH